MLSDMGHGFCLEEYIINNIRFVCLQGEHTQVTYLTKRRFHSAGCGFPDFYKNDPKEKLVVDWPHWLSLTGEGEI